MIRQRQAVDSATPGIEIVQTDDGSRTLRKVGTVVTWHSESGALAESQLVFLENSGALQRIRDGRPTNIFEVGFGTGLNFWLTASAALEHSCRLNYESVEPNLLDQQTLKQLQYDQLASCQPAYQCMFDEIFPSTRSSNHNGTMAVSHAEVGLQLHETSLDQVLKLEHPENRFDAIYFDPFSPESAPQLWQTKVYQQLLKMLKPSGKLVTYCVKSQIQRELSSTGFDIQKTRGPIGGKREVLIATKPA